MRLLGLFFVAVAVAPGCDNVESTDLSTEDLRLFVNAELSGTGGDVLAQLTTDNEALLEETFVNLSTGDLLMASLDSETRQMTEEFVVGVGIYQYRATFDAALGDELLVVSLSRSEHEDAPDSSVVIPMPFEIDDVAAGFSRADGLTVTWSNTGSVDRSRVSVDGACIESVDLDFDGNPGRVELRPRDFVMATNFEPTESCEVTLTVRTRIDGVVDAAYGRGGTIAAAQVRSLQLNAGP